MRDLPRGTITLLLTAIEGSTRLLHYLGERYAGLLAACRQVLRTAFQEFHGYEVDAQSDAHRAWIEREWRYLKHEARIHLAATPRKFIDVILTSVRDLGATSCTIMTRCPGASSTATASLPRGAHLVVDHPKDSHK